MSHEERTRLASLSLSLAALPHLDGSLLQIHIKLQQLVAHAVWERHFTATVGDLQCVVNQNFFPFPFPPLFLPVFSSLLKYH